MKDTIGAVGPVKHGVYRFDARAIAAGTLGLLALALLAIAIPENVPKIVTVPPVFLALVTLPGGLALLLLVGSVRVDLRWILSAIGLSLLGLMALGAVLNVALLAVGYERPMTTVPLATGVTVVVLGLLAAFYRVRREATIEVSVPQPQPLLFALLLVPLLSIVAVKVLNLTGTNVPIIGVLVAVAVLPLALVTFADRSWYGFGLWTMAIAILYHKSLARIHNFSGSPDVVYTYEAGYWRPGLVENTPEASELLANGVLYPSFARLTELEIFTQMEVVNPLFISTIPVALYVVARGYVGEKRALLVGALFAFAHPFYLQFPPGGRAGTPVVFLGLLALVLTDDRSDPQAKQLLALLFALGVVVSHYGTSYLLLFALLGASALVIVYPIVDDVIAAVRVRFFDRSTDAEGEESPGIRHPIGRGRYSSGILTYSFVSFYLVADLAWYLYLDAGEKFHLLPNHIVRTVQTLLVGQTFSGQTANRLRKDYGGLSITMSKWLYMAIGLLMVAGLATIYYRRFLTEEGTAIDDEHVALATVFLGVFSMTILVPSWGGGRPMMITFVFTTLYAVIGATVLFDGVAATVSDRLTGFRRVLEGDEHALSPRAFACLLLVLFLLNSGVLAVTALGGSAPSNVPSQSGTSYQEMDVATHAWFIDHREQVGGVYGDNIVHGQTDWLNPQIAYRAEGAESYGSYKPRGGQEMLRLAEPGVPSGYVVLLSHNVVGGTLRAEGSPALRTIRSDLSNRNIVYTSGYSQIYFANGTGG